MSRVLAAIDNSSAARPVLMAATMLSRLLRADLRAVHVRENGDLTAKAGAADAGMPLKELLVDKIPGSKIRALLEAAEPIDVEAMVVGARATRIGRLPAGRVALDLIVSLRKPLLVVPPLAVVTKPFERIFVPLDGTPATAATLAHTIELAQEADVEIIALHVHTQSDLPRFSDQPQHEFDVWRREFLARNCPHADNVRLEVRIGIPAEHVLRAAVESSADLIALGWAQNLDEGRAAVVREALERSDVPILLLPLAGAAP